MAPGQQASQTASHGKREGDIMIRQLIFATVALAATPALAQQKTIKIGLISTIDY